MVCPKCGAENLNDAMFCSSCGSTLNEAGDTIRPVSRDRSDQMCFGGSNGMFPGMMIGIIIIIVGVTSFFGQNFGVMTGHWGEEFGEGIGRWGENIGRFFAKWGTSWGSKIGASFSIIIGLAILYFVLVDRGRW